ncbi:hypothetical protein [Chryseobacterium caseinilyticum]|uniref:Uncharacterized protein n=1 Tax=Chryseobacterium caseinilyticum TaxID=2771428 RepID=A0ABR8Z897_9FLAO|nr:hypothetical protein [Chryseobacterium caseinilyticum]MBD8081465.1 hypothetical protein [Chryseobacterium caseinilyticum]
MTDVVNHFFLEKSIKNEDLTIINPDNKLETWLFLNELRKLQNSKVFINNYTLMYEVTSVEAGNKDNFTIRLNCYFEDKEIKNSVAKIEIILQEINSKYLVSSTIKNNLTHWKLKSIENYSFYSGKEVDEKNLRDFIAKNNKLSFNLKEQKIPTKVYCVDDIFNAYGLLGIDYKRDNSPNNFFLGVELARDNNQSTMIVATEKGMLEDFSFGTLWKARITEKYPIKNLYVPVLEGYSYINDGDPFYKWEQLWIQFKSTYSDSQKTDWLSLYGTKENFSLPSTPKYTENVLNALLIKKIEKEKGFSSVLELLNCGKFDSENQDNYFKTLEKVSGITKANFNENIDKLITRENLNR